MDSSTRYELLDRIAMGGMAELFRARIVGEQGFYKIVAVKRILPQYAGDEIFVRMLVDEARTASHLSHPSIAEIYELRRDAEGGFFIAMEFVNGPSLAALLRKLNEAKLKLPVPCALDIAIHLLEALDYSHRMGDSSGHPLGLVHRDVSPDNVLVTRDGSVKLTDFGVAKARGRMTQTQQGTIKGKLAYMSPEQVRGLEIDGRADTFAAALVLWEALTGKMYYDTPTDFDLMKAVAEGRSRKFSEVGLAVAPEIEAAMARALAVDPAQRYPRAADFAQELASYHRRTYPDYSPSALGKVVDEHFGDRFQILAERLRRFESGEEKPSGLLSPAPSDVATGPVTVVPLSPPAPPAPVPAKRVARPEPTPSPKKIAKPDAFAKRSSSRSELPAGKKPKAEKQEKQEPAKSAKATPPDRAADDKAIKAAIKKAGSEEKKEKGTSKAASVLFAFLAFALAAGLGIGGMAYFKGDATAWLKGEDTDGTPPPPQARPLVAPDDSGPPQKVEPPPKRPKEPKKGEHPSVAAPPVNPNPEPPADGPKGTLTLECDPGDCEIEIDGRKVGFAPLHDVELVAGAHKVKAINKLIHLKKLLTVEIAAGKATKKAINLVKD